MSDKKQQGSGTRAGRPMTATEARAHNVMAGQANQANFPTTFDQAVSNREHGYEQQNHWASGQQTSPGNIPAPPREPALIHSMEALEMYVGRVDAQVRNLKEKLLPVLRGQGPSTDTNASGGALRASCPASERIDQSSAFLLNISEDLSDLIDRLEV